MGVLPGFLPDSVKWVMTRRGAALKKRGKVTLPARPGHNAMEMITGAAEGRPARAVPGWGKSAAELS